MSTATEDTRHVSVESLDLALDLDLEKRLDAPSPASPTATPVAPGPATLAHDDPENPRLWSTPKKVLVNVVLCTWVLSLTYASTAYIGSLAALESRFQISQEVALLGVTLTVLGFAAGPLVFGPASEVFGRRACYTFCGLLYSAFAWGTETHSAPVLLICRFFIGFFGSASINTVPASIGDYTYPHNRNRYSILYATMAFGGPALGPLCSSFIEVNAGFRTNLRVMAAFITVTSALVALVPETHGPTLYKRKLRRECKAKDVEPPSSGGIGRVMAVFKIALSRPIIFLTTEPIVTLISLYLSTLYAILYACFESFSVVYVEIRGFSATSYGLTYIGLGLGFLVGAAMLATIGDRLYQHFSRQAAAQGKPCPPEARLGLAYVGAIVTPISLFLFAWTAPYTSVHWIVPCIASGMFSASMLLIFTAFIPYLIDVYATYAASALAAGMASRALIGSVFPLFALQMYQKLTVQGATSLLAGLSCCLAPIPFLLAKYGERLRSKSKYSA